jgi:hypothetical protein
LETRERQRAQSPTLLGCFVDDRRAPDLNFLAEGALRV